MAKQLMFTSRRIDGTTASQIGLVDVAVPNDALDDAVARLAAEVMANSNGTNRRVKLLIADGDDLTRTEALVHERLMPHGVPEDMAERMAGG